MNVMLLDPVSIVLSNGIHLLEHSIPALVSIDHAFLGRDMAGITMTRAYSLLCQQMTIICNQRHSIYKHPGHILPNSRHSSASSIPLSMFSALRRTQQVSRYFAHPRAVTAGFLALSSSPRAVISTPFAPPARDMAVSFPGICPPLHFC